jgi:hypothetical protein
VTNKKNQLLLFLLGIARMLKKQNERGPTAACCKPPSFRVERFWLVGEVFRFKKVFVGVGLQQAAGR